jgi:hypothetical protein
MRLGSLKRGVGLDRQQNILQARIILVDVMHVVGGDILARIPRAQFLSSFLFRVGDLFDVVLLQFHKEAVAAEDLVIPVPFFHGFFRVFIQQRARNLRRHTA